MFYERDKINQLEKAICQCNAKLEKEVAYLRNNVSTWDVEDIIAFSPDIIEEIKETKAEIRKLERKLNLLKLIIN